MLLTDFYALTFDCYGTLIDWESGMIEALKGLAQRARRPLTRDEMLEAHARHRVEPTTLHPAKRYRDLLPIVYKRLAEEWGVHATHEECVAYGQSIANWPASRFSRRAQLPQETFQARHPFQRRQQVVRGVLAANDSLSTLERMASLKCFFR